MQIAPLGGGVKLTGCNMEAMMDEDVFNASIRKLLKKLVVTAQREI